jgi:hypothetical protein
MIAWLLSDRENITEDCTDNVKESVGKLLKESSAKDDSYTSIIMILCDSRMKYSVNKKKIEQVDEKG